MWIDRSRTSFLLRFSVVGIAWERKRKVRTEGFSSTEQNQFRLEWKIAFTIIIVPVFMPSISNRAMAL
jgi:hypothetical protein